VGPDGFGPISETTVAKGFQEDLRDALVTALIACIAFEPSLIADPRLTLLLKTGGDLADIV
jgi:hypothetical protein